MEPANDAVDSVNDVVESVKDAVESVNDAVESVIDDIEEEVEQTMDESGGEDGCCRDNKACLRASLIVGGSLLFTDIILAIVALSSPEAVGISEDDALSKGQRGFLGFITLIIIIEGFVIATCDWYREAFDAREKKKRDKMNDGFQCLQYWATVTFGEAMFMAVWVVAILLVTNNWMAVCVTAAVAVAFPILKYWQKLIDPYSE